MKIKLEYPYPVYFHRDEEIFKDTSMFDLSFDSKIHYFKNYDTGFGELLLKLLGFGIRFEWKHED